MKQRSSHPLETWMHSHPTSQDLWDPICDKKQLFYLILTFINESDSMHMAFYPSSQSEFKYRFYGSLEREPCYFLGTCSSQNCYFFLLKAAVLVLVSAKIMEKVAGFRKGNLVTTVLNFCIPIYKAPSSLAHFLVFRLHTRCGCC